MSALNASTLSASLMVVSLVVSVLLQLINLRFQKEAESVFQTLPKSTYLAFAILLAFGWACGMLAWVGDKLSPAWSALLINAMVFFASPLVASLASLVFPDALPSLARMCQRVGQKIIDKLHSLFTRIQQFYLKRNPPVLPLTNKDTGYPVPRATNPQY